MKLTRSSAKTSVVLVAAIAGIFALTAVGLYYSNSNKAFNIPISSVEAEQVRRGSIVRRINVVGTLVANQKVVMNAEVDGLVKAIHFQGGEAVNAGDVLVEVEDAVFQAATKEAEAVYINAKAEFERQKALAAKNIGAGKMLDKAQADFLAAEARMEKAKLDLKHTKVVAPFEGYVSLNNLSQGMLLDRKTELLTIVDLDPIKLDFRLPASYLKSISVGQSLKVHIDGYGKQVFDSKIESIDATVDPTAHSVVVRAVIANPKGRLKPGLFGRVSIVVGSSDDALLLPEQAVSGKGDDEFVYILRKAPPDQPFPYVAVKQKVQTGLSESGTVEIVRYLREGDLIVTVGQNKIRHGYPVKLKSSSGADDDEVDEDDLEPTTPEGS